MPLHQKPSQIPNSIGLGQVPSDLTHPWPNPGSTQPWLSFKTLLLNKIRNFETIFSLESCKMHWHVLVLSLCCLYNLMFYSLPPSKEKRKKFTQPRVCTHIRQVVCNIRMELAEGTRVITGMLRFCFRKSTMKTSPSLLFLLHLYHNFSYSILHMNLHLLYLGSLQTPE